MSVKKKGENYDLIQKVRRRLNLVYNTQMNMLTRRGTYDSIGIYCMFIGYPRSGHTLIGASLDAHPNVILGHEMDALKYVIKGESRDKLYSRLLCMSKTFISIGKDMPQLRSGTHFPWNARCLWKSRPEHAYRNVYGTAFAHGSLVGCVDVIEDAH